MLYIDKIRFKSHPLTLKTMTAYTLRNSALEYRRGGIIHGFVCVVLFVDPLPQPGTERAGGTNER